MKQEFFDQLDGGWGDLIADTYKKTNETLLEFPIDDYQFIDSFFVASYKDKTIERLIIKTAPEIRISIEESDHIYGRNYAIYFNNVPLKCIKYKLIEDDYSSEKKTYYEGITPLNGDNENSQISFSVDIVVPSESNSAETKKNKYYIYMCTDSIFTETDSDNLYRSNYFLPKSSFIENAWEEEPIFGDTVMNMLKDRGLVMNNVNKS